MFDQYGAGIEQFHGDLGDVGLEVMNDALLLGISLGLIQVVRSLFNVDQRYLQDYPIVMTHRSELDQVLYITKREQDRQCQVLIGLGVQELERR